MGIFGKKKAKSSADPDEEMTREVNEMLSDLNEKIESVDKKYLLVRFLMNRVCALEARRQALLDQAIAANEEQRYLGCVWI